MKTTTMLPRCYCCGKEIGDTLALVAMSADPDRAFLFLPEHAHRADASHIIVRLVNRPKPEPIPDERRQRCRHCGCPVPCPC
jgi:hypothetical protein